MRRLISAWLGRRELARAEAALAEHPFSGPECAAASRALTEAAKRVAAIDWRPITEHLRGMVSDVVPGAGEAIARREDDVANRALGFVACDTVLGHERAAGIGIACPRCGAAL